MQIKLINDNSISFEDIELLTKWLNQKPTPQLTQGPLVTQFEKEFSKYQDCKYSVFVNSGSSANLLMLYTLMKLNLLKNNRIIVPAVSWSTTVAPVIQLGMSPIFCDCELDTLGTDPEHLKFLIKKYNPAAVILVHVLGFPCKMKEIIKICNDNNVLILEDSCESLGSTYDNIKTGNFGMMSTFSFFWSHIISTIEGGMICTNDKSCYDMLKMCREHGWARRIDKKKRASYQKKYKINDYKEYFSFYVEGFNFRNTEINAHIGLSQMKKIERIVNNRNKNYLYFRKKISSAFWKPKNYKNVFVSSYAYPLIYKDIDFITQTLAANEVENRPLCAGNIQNQPFIRDYFDSNGITPESTPNADIVDRNGFYVPNNPELTNQEIEYICNIANKGIPYTI